MSAAPLAPPPIRKLPYFVAKLESHPFRFLSALDSYARNFFWAVDLITQSDRAGKAAPNDPRWEEWKMIAIRDGALTIFHIAHTLIAIKASASRSGENLDNVNHDLLREARREFKDRFPDYDAVRRAVAHSAELAMNSKERARNSVKSTGGTITLGPGITMSGVTEFQLGSMLNGVKFSSTVEGKLVSYELSWDNWRFLDGIAAKVFLAFEPGENSTGDAD